MARRKTFDPELALDRAVELFWALGYEATTVNALVDAMGISRQSLYDTFGDKQALFVRALDRFNRTHVDRWLAGVEQPDAAGDALRAFFAAVPQVFGGDPQRRSCLLVNTMSERPADPESLARTRAHRLRLEGVFTAALQRAAERGEVQLTLPARAHARALAGVILGITVASKSGASVEALTDMSRVALVGLGLSLE
ncbi:MAG: TetR/AcrR family transcriptional regulator [Alphaproteobacteria bacterium]|nr:TetR/AcrR family transcriptional regulator [Alphaproteobacteria bacterium]